MINPYLKLHGWFPSWRFRGGGNHVQVETVTLAVAFFICNEVVKATGREQEIWRNRVKKKCISKVDAQKSRLSQHRRII